MDEGDRFARKTFRTATAGESDGRRGGGAVMDLEAEFRAIMRREFGTDNVRDLKSHQLGWLGQYMEHFVDTGPEEVTNVVSMDKWRFRNRG
jgi:hypothetical protein